MSVKLNLIAAACENMGIGKNNDLPWRLKKEMQYFTRMTTSTTSSNKKNVVIMGRKTWDGIPQKYKPFSKRINFILSRSKLDLDEYKDTYGFTSLNAAIEHLNDNEFKKDYETVWVIGGSHIYKLAMEHENLHRIYLTKIKKTFDCDTFLPPLGDNLKEISDPNIPTEIQEENGIQYEFKIYENIKFNN